MGNVGRPPMYKNPELLKAKVDEYFNTASIKTITGLALYCGFASRKSFYDIAKKPEYKDVLTEAKNKINPVNNKAKFNYSMPFSAKNRLIERLKLDHNFRLRFNFSSLLRYHIKKGGNKTFDIVGYTINQLKQHLEQQFDSKMNWDNYGSYWHIDHIKPASSFNQKNDIEFKECWSLENLQPLEAKENMRKGARLNFLTQKKVV